jgi:hypothetical protein
MSAQCLPTCWSALLHGFVILLLTVTDSLYGVVKALFFCFSGEPKGTHKVVEEETVVECETHIVECKHLALMQGGRGGLEVMQHMVSQPCAHLSTDFNSHQNSHLLKSISHCSPSIPYCTHKMPPRGKRRKQGTPSPRKRPTKKAREGRDVVQEEHLLGGALQMEF